MPPHGVYTRRSNNMSDTTTFAPASYDSPPPTTRTISQTQTNNDNTLFTQRRARVEARVPIRIADGTAHRLHFEDGPVFHGDESMVMG